MPIGNGDIGLNVWVETNGNVVLYIAARPTRGIKTTRWDSFEALRAAETRRRARGAESNPFTAGARSSQNAWLYRREIEIRQGYATNLAVLRVCGCKQSCDPRRRTSSNQPVSVNVSLINW